MGEMGFKNQKLFNQALLDKQGSHLIQVLNTLVTQVLCGKYYHCTDFLHVGWTSILYLEINFIWYRFIEARYKMVC